MVKAQTKKNSAKKQNTVKKDNTKASKSSKSVPKKTEEVQTENDLIETGDHDAILKNVTKKEKKVPQALPQKKVKKASKKNSKTSERKFVKEDDESENEEEVYEKLFPTKLKMGEDDNKNDEDNNEEDTDLGLGNPLKLIVPKAESKTSSQVAKLVEEKKKEQVKLTSSVIYIGHIPNGFFEKQLKAYFSQFGTVKNVRVSRSHRTGKSRGYGFIQFEDPFVAAVAADTMDKHRAFGRTLVCRVVPKENLDESMWKWSKFPFNKFNYANFKEKMRLIYNSKCSDEEYNEKLVKLLEQEKKLRQKIKDAGINYSFPGYEQDIKNKKVKVVFKEEKEDTDEIME